jgi:serine/threonine-protein kinase
MFNARYDPSSERAARQLEEAEAALRLAPDLPQAHGAMGLAHQYARRDYPRALEEYRIALEGLPNDARAWANIGYIHRRMGHWDETLAAFEKATELDPRNVDLFYVLGANTYAFMHRYDEAVRTYGRALSLAPDLHGAAVSKGHTYVSWHGKLDTLRAVLSRLPMEAELFGTGSLAAEQLRLLLWERRPDSVLQILTTARTRVFESFSIFFPSSLYAAWAHTLRGDRPAARLAFDSARVLLDSVIRELPNDGRVHSARGLALAGLRRSEEALSEARWLQQSFSYRGDEAEAALDEIERLLAEPSWVSVHKLRLDPLWDPIRDHPRFRELLEKYEN